MCVLRCFALLLMTTLLLLTTETAMPPILLLKRNDENPHTILVYIFYTLCETNEAHRTNGIQCHHPVPAVCNPSPLLPTLPQMAFNLQPPPSSPAIKTPPTPTPKTTSSSRTFAICTTFVWPRGAKLSGRLRHRRRRRRRRNRRLRASTSHIPSRPPTL